MSEPGKILVIDDDADVRKVLCDNLGECGHDVIGAENGYKGLEILRGSWRPDIVITDIIMPDKEGLEVILEIRTQYPDMRIIAISGGGRTKTADFLSIARKLGADRVIPKPVDLDFLETTINHLLPPASPP